MMREVRLAGLAIAAAGALLLGVYFISLAFGPPEGAPAARDAATVLAMRRANIESTIEGTPDVSPFFDRLRVVLPGEYAMWLQKAASASPDPALDTPDFWLSDAVKVVRQSHGALAVKADATPLSEIFARQAAVLAALAARDARLCVDFLYGGASEGFFAFAAENRALVGALALASLDAIADGQAKKLTREMPTDADFAALEGALREKGLNDAEITALLDGKSPEPPLPDGRLCDMGRLYLDALAGLPEETRLRLYALAIGLMARS